MYVLLLHSKWKMKIILFIWNDSLLKNLCLEMNVYRLYSTLFIIYSKWIYFRKELYVHRKLLQGQLLGRMHWHFKSESGESSQSEHNFKKRSSHWRLNYFNLLKNQSHYELTNKIWQRDKWESWYHEIRIWLE